MDPEEYNEYQRGRYEKIAQLREMEREPYPSRSHRTHTSAQAIEALAAASPDEGEGPRVTVAGRVVGIRVMGKAAFAHLEDGAGRIQLHIRRDALGEEEYQLFKKKW